MQEALAGKPTLMTLKFETIAPTALQQKINLVLVYFSQFGSSMFSMCPVVHYSALSRRRTYQFRVNIT